MPEEGHSRGDTRLLSIVLHATHLGVAVVDRLGLVDGGFRVLDVHHRRGADVRIASARERVAQLVDRHRPSRVLIAMSRSASPRMVRAVRAFLRERGAIVEHADITDARVLVLGQRRGVVPNALARQLVAGFAPELRSHLVSSLAGRRSRRQAWSALAIAITWLVRHRPRSAFAMAHAPAFATPGLAMAIAEADRRLHPEPV